MLPVVNCELAVVRCVMDLANLPTDQIYCQQVNGSLGGLAKYIGRRTTANSQLTSMILRICFIEISEIQ